jgi:RsiW-degrading membrane proteinase PrsW (M82 family)
MDVARSAAPQPPLGHDSTFKWLALIFGGLVLSFFGLIALGLVVGTTGVVGFLAGVILAALPVPIYVSLWLWIDRFEPEPAWLLACAFFWGAIVASIGAIFLNSSGGIVVAVASHNTDIAENFAAVLSAPLVEETLKGLFLLLLVLWRRQDFDGIIDGIVYAGMVGLGFAMTENVLYYGREAGQQEQGNVLAVLFLRGVLSPFLHPWLTSMTGIGFGVARETRLAPLKYAAPLFGWILAILLHLIWNLSGTVSSALFFGMYVLFAVPVFLCTLGVVLFALMREGRMIRRNLKPELDDGTLTLDELRRMGSVTGRLSASLGAFLSGGFQAWNTRRKFVEAATTLAFHRDRMDAGTVARDDSARDFEENLRQWVFYWGRKLRR